MLRNRPQNTGFLSPDFEFRWSGALCEKPLKAQLYIIPIITDLDMFVRGVRNRLLNACSEIISIHAFKRFLPNPSFPGPLFARVRISSGLKPRSLCSMLKLSAASDARETAQNRFSGLAVASNSLICVSNFSDALLDYVFVRSL